MNRFIILLFLICPTFFSYSQILIGGEEQKETDKEKKDKAEKEVLKKEKEDKTTDGKTSIYFLTNWSKTNRLLKENGDLFGDSLGTRADENPLNTWSFGIGIRNVVHPFIFWEGGISYYRNGESYIFQGTDTMFSYQTYYNYIAMPVKINAFYGENFKWHAGVGLIPQMFINYRQEQQWQDSENTTGKKTIKTKSGYNSFVVSAVFSAGLTMNFNNGWALFATPEARIQLNSSYTKTDSYIHKGRAYGISFGLIRNL